MIANIVICYANELEILSYAKELMKQVCSDRIMLIVVVNKVGESGREFLEKELGLLNIEFELYDVGENIGYLNGLVYGYKKSERVKKCEWVIFSNTDIKISDGQMIERFLTNQLCYADDVWLVGPSIFVPLQNAFSNPYLSDRPSKLSYIKKICGMQVPFLYHILYVVKRRLQRNRNSEKVKIYSKYIYAIHGSYMFLKHSFMQELMKRKEWEVLYSEEQYLAEIVRECGRKVYFDASLQVEHLEGTSTSKVNINNRYRMMQKANRRILKEFY